MLAILFISDTLLASSSDGGKFLEINGVQVFVMDASYQSDYNNFFKELKDQGVNTVFFRVFHNRGDRPHLGLEMKCDSGVYFRTTELCTVADILDDIVTSAHKNGIKLYAWMATRSITALKERDLSLSFSPNGGTVEGYGANIFKKDIRKRLVTIFTDLARYNIDGVLVQDDFIVKYNEGADDHTLDLFKSDTGFSPTPSIFFNKIKEYNGKKVFSGYHDVFYIWSLWKNEYLINLLRDIKVAIRKVNKDIKLAVNIYYETPIAKEKGLAWYSQTISGLLSVPVDYVAVMGYIDQISNELEMSYEETVTYILDIAKTSIDQIPFSNRVIMKLQVKPFRKGIDYIDNKYNIEICKMLKNSYNGSIVLLPINNPTDVIPSCFETN